MILGVHQPGGNEETQAHLAESLGSMLSKTWFCCPKKSQQLYQAWATQMNCSFLTVFIH